MADELHLQESWEIYENLCRTYSEKGLKFERHDENMVITFTMRGDDIPMEFVVQVIAGNRLVRLYSPLPVNVEESKTVEMVVATVYVNSKILNGAFDYNMKEHRLSFNILNAFHNSNLDDEVFVYMLSVAVSTVNKFNDLFFLLSKGMITIEQFMEEVDEQKV